jgi:hypothetical protein
MKTATRIGLLILLVVSAGIALAQLNDPGPPRGGPRREGRPGGEESAPDEGRPRPWPPRGEVGRFAIVLLSSGPLLLDSANGDTWSFVSDDTPAKGHWEPVHRQPMPERRERRPPRDERESSGGPPPDGPRGNRSGPESDRDRDN